MNNLLLLIAVPLAAGFLVLVLPNRSRTLRNAVSILATLANLIIIALSFKQNTAYIAPWSGYGFEFSLRLYNFSAFIILATACFGFLIMLYSSASLANKGYSKQFYSYLLLSLGFVNGAVLADNLIAMLFFWEGLLITLFGMIAIGNAQAFKTATKAFIIVGICDLCLVVGMSICGHLAGTFAISKMKIPVEGLGGIAFILLMIGAIAKAGSMPFHSWIPDAALDAPLPFMAIFPAALEKLLGIYFLTRISLDMFSAHMNSWASYTLMAVGSVTILLAVMMALIQKDYKRLLSYHAISQVGYMILGIGTFVPAGIVGGLFHMINNALYKSCLFLTGGSVEKETGTTDLNRLGGIGRKMPITFACFIITALSISGVPPFNGFFSKELVYDGALERGWIFYAAALIGSFFTAASFLKLGHAAFLGKVSDENRRVKEAPLLMLLPMAVIAILCVAFGVFNFIPIKILIQPILGPERLGGKSFAGYPSNIMLVIITVAVLIGALLNHIYGVKKTGRGIGAVDHIYHAPILSGIYKKAERGLFDPYNIGLIFINIFSASAGWFDKAIDWVYNDLIVKLAYFLAKAIKTLHDGSYRTYLIWSLTTVVFIAVFLISSLKQ